MEMKRITARNVKRTILKTPERKGKGGTKGNRKKRKKLQNEYKKRKPGIKGRRNTKIKHLKTPGRQEKAGTRKEKKKKKNIPLILYTTKGKVVRRATERGGKKDHSENSHY